MSGSAVIWSGKCDLFSDMFAFNVDALLIVGDLNSIISAWNLRPT